MRIRWSCSRREISHSPRVKLIISERGNGPARAYYTLLMSDKIDIPDLGKKISLILRSGRAAIKTEQQLMQKLGIGKDYWSRIKNGTRILTEAKFVDLCDLLQMEQKVWFHPLLD